MLRPGPNPTFQEPPGLHAPQPSVLASDTGHPCLSRPVTLHETKQVPRPMLRFQRERDPEQSRPAWRPGDTTQCPCTLLTVSAAESQNHCAPRVHSPHPCPSSLRRWLPGVRVQESVDTICLKPANSSKPHFSAHQEFLHLNDSLKLQADPRVTGTGTCCGHSYFLHRHHLTAGTRNHCL